MVMLLKLGSACHKLQSLWQPGEEEKGFPDLRSATVLKK